MRIPFILLAIGGALSTPVQSQTRGPKLPVVVRVASVEITGDTIAIGYEIENGRGSPMPIGSLALVTPATVVALEAPKGKEGWDTFRNHGDELMPTWAAFGAGVHAGQRSPILTLRATGVTDFVKYYAVPDIMETMKRDTIIHDGPSDRYVEWGAPGVVVSVVPPPKNLTPTGHMMRLQRFLTRSCGAEGWIVHQEVCDSLSTRLKTAADALASGGTAGARPHLAAFLAELERQRGPGKPVSLVAYALLAPNARFLMR